ncbi:unnamed protein product [Acidithrix sp. C25]|nr:unnamed protein product [Acidithrix sp. C25]
MTNGALGSSEPAETIVGTSKLSILTLFFQISTSTKTISQITNMTIALVYSKNFKPTSVKKSNTLIERIKRHTNQ